MADLPSEERLRQALLDLVSRPTARNSPAVLVTPEQCPNCGQACSSLSSPYCCNKCRDVAAFVRQTRSAIASGVVDQPERQIGLAQALWAIKGGGFPLRQAMVPEKARTKVIARDGGRCQVCGAPATEIDHTGSG